MISLDDNIVSLAHCIILHNLVVCSNEKSFLLFYFGWNFAMFSWSTYLSKICKTVLRAGPGAFRPHNCSAIEYTEYILYSWYSLNFNNFQLRQAGTVWFFLKGWNHLCPNVQLCILAGYSVEFLIFYFILAKKKKKTCRLLFYIFTTHRHWVASEDLKITLATL